MEEHLLCKQGVSGSSPLTSTTAVSGVAERRRKAARLRFAKT